MSIHRLQFWTAQELQQTQRVVQLVGRPVRARPPCQKPHPTTQPKLPSVAAKPPSLPPTAAPSCERTRPVQKSQPSSAAAQDSKSAEAAGASSWRVVVCKLRPANSAVEAPATNAKPAEPVEPVGAESVISKSAKKNARRKQNRAAQNTAGAEPPATAAATTTEAAAATTDAGWQTVAAAPPKPTRPTTVASNSARDALQELAGLSSRELISRVRTQCSGRKPLVQHVGQTVPEQRERCLAVAMGSLSRLGAGELSHILCSDAMPLASLAMLSCCCRALRSACDDGFVWRHMWQKHFPSSSLVAASSVAGLEACFPARAEQCRRLIGLLPNCPSPKIQSGCLSCSRPTLQTQRVDYAMPWLRPSLRLGILRREDSAVGRQRQDRYPDAAVHHSRALWPCTAVHRACSSSAVPTPRSALQARDGASHHAHAALDYRGAHRRQRRRCVRESCRCLYCDSTDSSLRSSITTS